MGNGGEMLECPELNQTIDLSLSGHKLESGECLLLSHRPVVQVFQPYVKENLVPFSE
jgi:hypothetical protein